MLSSTKTIVCHSGLAAILMLACAPAIAQQAVVPTDDRPVADGEGDIVVTARKRDERIGDVPIAISAYSGNALRDRGVSNLLELSNIAAGVVLREEYGGRASPSIVIRGVGYDDFRSNGNPAAAVHIDQVYLGSNALIGGQMFDVDRLEILKGPQGTLYGRNTTAGAVNIISRKPGERWERNASVEYGSYRHVQADAGIGGPLSDDLGIRIAATYDRGGGFMTNKGDASFAGLTSAPGKIPPLPLVTEQHHVGDADFFATRATLVYAPASGTTITAQLGYARDRGDNSQGDVIGTSATGFTEPDSDPYTYYGNLAPAIHSDQITSQLRLDQALGGTTLTVIGAYVGLDRDYTFDPGDPRRNGDLRYSDNIKQYTGEARLHGAFGTAIDWTLGTFYFRDRIGFGSTLDFSDLLRSVVATDYIQRRESWAAFGEADWHIAPRLTATLGLRYTNEKSRFQGATTDLDPYGISRATAAFGLPVRFDNPFRDDNLSGRVVLSYRPIADVLTYASVSRGFKSGGFDGSTIFSLPEAQPFKSERVTAYEVGTKFFSKDGPVTLSAAAFYYDFANLQANSIRMVGPISTSIRTNVADATIYGAELELTVRPSESLTLGFSAAYLHARVDNFVSDNSAEAARRTGNALPDSPPLSLNANASYAQPVGGGWTLTPSIDASFTAKHYKELDNYTPVAGYGLLNFRLALTSPGSRWTFAAFGRNVTDHTYFVGLAPVTNTAGAVIGNFRIAGTPATYGVSAGMKF